MLMTMMMMMKSVVSCADQVYTEFDDDSGQRSPRFTTSIHEVIGVVDARSRRILSFSDAVRRGIIDPATGVYHNGVTGRLVYPSDAIRQGLLKTKLLNEFRGSSAAWLAPSGRPLLPGELGTMARVQPGGDSVLPGELSSWPGTTSSTASSDHVRRTISGWLLDL